MEHSKRYSKLSITVFGRGSGVEFPDGIRFQRLDHQLNNQLASLFAQVILVPLVYRYGSPLWENFAQYYKEEVKCNEIRVLPVYNYASFNGTNKFAIRINAWKNWAPSLFRALRSSDLALIFFPSTLGLIGFTIGLVLRKPMIAYVGGEWSIVNPKVGELTKPRGFERLFVKSKSLVGNFLIRNFPAVLMRDYGLYKRWSKRRSGVFYVPGNTAVSKDDLFERSDTCLGEPIICLVVGSIVPQKGVDDIVRAIKMLRQKGYPLKLWHVGGSYPENLAASVSLCQRLRVDKHVVFHGYKNDLGELLALYRNADIFVLASHSEGYPRSITEAQSQSLPIIATRVGGIPARLENEHHAILTNPGRPEEIAGAIERVINDNTLRRRLIANGYLLAEEELCGRSAIEVITEVITERFPELHQGCGPE